MFNPSDSVAKFGRVAPPQLAALKRLGVNTMEDLLRHVPTRYVDAGKATVADMADLGERVTLYGRIEKLETKKSFQSKIPMGEAVMRDSSGRIKLVWFNQPYMAKMVAAGDSVSVSGVLQMRGNTRTMNNPEMEKIASLPDTSDGMSASLFGETLDPSARFYPVYPESRGITSSWIYHKAKRLLAEGMHEHLVDPIPEEVLSKYNLPHLSSALVWLHTPREMKHAEAARKRFAFEEIFMIQLERWKARLEYEASPSWRIVPEKAKLAKFTKNFGFPLTGAQEDAVKTILDDFAAARPMLRLLEGDVGSGKTAVAASTAYSTIATRPPGQDFGTLQVAYMCPTEILATQHFESFIKYFVGTGIQIALMTGSGCRKFPSKVNPDGWTDISRNQLLKWVANGEIAIVIGTHALISKTVEFEHLAYVIIDEQHRFGTGQRAKLLQKDGRIPHLLSMTATPIPRTLALTLYGDLDLTLLDVMPSGRKPIITKIADKNKRDEVYAHVKEELAAGRQAYVICPRINEPDPDKEQTVAMRSVKEEAERLRTTVFKGKRIDILHSKMKPAEKDEVMMRFYAHEIDILVATSVVEVGVNVPNATVILIEGSERFGLAQLHQLRGRVIRGNHQAYCYLFAESQTEKTKERLKAMVTAKNGFELSELDLELRGAGELAGTKQWGISDIGMEAIRNIKMVEAARKEAQLILAGDHGLDGYPLLRNILEERKKHHHE
jgi:ATP-dependent DNA helicase RecG